MGVSELDLERSVDVAAVEDIPEGEGRCYEVDGVAVAVFHDQGAFYAVGVSAQVTRA